MSMNGLLVVGVSLCAGVLALPEAARGQATLVLDERYVQAELQLQDFGGTAVGPSTMVTPTSLGAAFNQSFGYSGHHPGHHGTQEGGDGAAGERRPRPRQAGRDPVARRGYRLAGA